MYCIHTDEFGDMERAAQAKRKQEERENPGLLASNEGDMRGGLHVR